MKSAPIPLSVQRDPKAIQLLSAWLSQDCFHCALNVGHFHAQGQQEAQAWGALFAELIRSLANAMDGKLGLPARETTAALLASLISELEAPTSESACKVLKGHP